MIAFLKGICIEKTPTRLVLDINGVGYEVGITLQCYNAIGSIDEEVLVHTHMAVSENDMSLYGFGSSDEKQMFRYLIAVNGIGPKLALAILSGIPVIELKQAIAFGDLAKLKSVSGIGKKTAERMIVELKDKLGKIEIDMRSIPKNAQAQIDLAKKQNEVSQINDAANEAILALISLGYKKVNAEKTVKKLLKDDPFLSLEDIIKHSLRSL